MRNKRQFGLTLIELLVSMAVISLLLVLTMPGVQAAREATRKVRCGSNMHQIAIGYQEYRAKYGGEAGGVTPGNWISLLKPYFQSVSSILICTNDRLTNSKANALSEYKLAYQDSTGETFTYPLGEGMHARRSTKPEQLEATTGKYRDDAASDSYFLEWGGWSTTNQWGWATTSTNWKDIIMLVDVYENRVHCRTVSSSTKLNLKLLGPDGRLVSSSVGSIDISTTATDKTSYGINGKVSLFSRKSDAVIFLVEYYKSIANSGDKFDEWVAPRHNGMVNVVFPDTHVETKSPKDIHPGVSEFRKTYWDP
jgi:prepilin-type N-terminal cleavage/methylation domain-containing protein/prepilin-type processing-associated H-X9-DG protein